jgi:phosphoribosylformylglycinamidine cyclo-ligase
VEHEIGQGLTYDLAGVSISRGNAMVEAIKPLAASTYRPEVMGGLGGFGGLFALDMSKYRRPVLVSGTDGVGTKLAVAQAAGIHDTIGIDCVAMCVNDILVSGAEPLFFLDYLAVGRLDAEQGAQIVKGVAEGCRQAQCALIGGETAEMPGFYPNGAYDVAGFAVGVVERDRLIDGRRIVPGDQLVGIASDGLHSNGFSLARQVVFQRMGLRPGDFVEALGTTAAQALLRPTRIYVALVRSLMERFDIKGMSHITGGGLLENPQRILPDHTRIELHWGAWETPAVFPWIQAHEGIQTMEMLRVFNMGIGFCLIVGREQRDALLGDLKARGEKAWCIGQVAEGAKGVSVRGLEA